MSIEVKNLIKVYGDTRALDGVSIEFKPGKIYGLLGRNGTGKSTLLSIISNRIFATEGEVFLDGEITFENDRVLQQIYFMSERNSYPEKLKLKELFHWTKNFYPNFDMEYALKLAKKFDLNMNKKVKELSTGYRSIFKAIIALSVNVPYVFLDEPVLGLDANHRELLYRSILDRYIETSCTFVISTHLIEEVSSIIEHVIVIHKGKILIEDDTESLLSKGYTVSGPGALVEEFIKGKETIGMDSIGGLKSAHLMGNVNEVVIPDGLEVNKLDLQRLFVKLTNE